MPRSIVLLVIMGSCVVVVAASYGQAPSANIAEKASQSAEDLAAFIAFSRKASQPYTLNNDELEAIVNDYFSKQGAGTLRKVPEPNDLKALLDAQFQMKFSKLISEAMEGFAPDRRSDIEKRLKEYLSRNPSIGEEVKKSYQEYAQKNLPKALENVKKRMVENQADNLQDVLRAYLDNKGLTMAQIENAYTRNEESILIDKMRDDILKACDDQLRMSLLADSYTILRGMAQKVVENGTRQLREQMEVGNRALKAQTCEGLEKELRELLHKLVDKQKQNAGADPSCVAFGEFPLAKEHLPATAQQWFDTRVAEATRQVEAELLKGTQSIPRERTDAIRKQIADNSSDYYETERSKTLLKPWIEQRIWRNDRQWIIKYLTDVVFKENSEFDRGHSSDQFNKDVDHALAGGAKSKAAWNELQIFLLGKYMDSVPDIRRSIAEEQARRYAPELAAKGWRPSEEQITEQKGDMNRQQLLKLPVWTKGQPQREKDVLSETWDLWLNNARDALKTGWQAYVGQEKLIDERRPVYFERLKDKANRDFASLREEYTQDVLQKWTAMPGTAPREYPDLFTDIKRRIADIVAELLSGFAQDRSDGTSQIAQSEPKTSLPSEPSPGTSPVSGSSQLKTDARGLDASGFPANKSPPHDSNAGQTELPDQKAKNSGAAQPEVTENGPNGTDASQSDPNHSEDRKLGAASKQPTKSETETTKAGETEQQNDPDPTGEPTDHKVAEYAKILEEQNYLVDQLEKAMRSEMEKALESGQPFDAEKWINKYLAEMTKKWILSPYAWMWPKILPPIAQRIKGLVAEYWLNADRVGLGYSDMKRFPYSGGGGDDPNGQASDDGFGLDGRGYYMRAYRIGFWTILLLLCIQSACWWWNIKYIREYITARRRSDPTRSSMVSRTARLGSIRIGRRSH
jgi:hypothetical protein